MATTTECPCCGEAAQPRGKSRHGARYRCGTCKLTFDVLESARPGQGKLAFDQGERSDSKSALNDKEPSGGQPDGSEFARDLADHGGGASAFSNKDTLHESYETPR